MTTYIIDKRYKTGVKRTPNVLEIAESFGLGLDDKEFVVFDKQPIDVLPGDVVYITGQSGSGKSTILRELQKQMTAEGLKVADIDGVELLDVPIADQFGPNLKRALDILSVAGLNDAYVWLRRPEELSDGQRYRLRLAKIIESGASVWAADEFLAVLDRDTAKILANNMQKIARSVGATLMVATTHPDLLDDLAPSLYVEKLYRERVKVVRAPEGFANVETEQ